MLFTIDGMAGILEEEFEERRFNDCDCRNGHPGTDWMVVGNAAFTRAIKAAGLPWTQFWSGSAPTPSTQAPEEIVKYCDRNFRYKK